jgi:hypothetical protein
MAKTGATKKRGAVERKPRKSKASSTAKVPKRAKVDVQKLSCCKYLAAVVLIAANLVISGFGVSLSVLATKIILSGFSFGAWYIVALGISSALVLFGLYGASAANQYRGGPPREAKAKTRTRPRQERDTISTGGATESFYRNEVDSAAAPVDRGAGRLEHYFVLLVGLFVVQVCVPACSAGGEGSRSGMRILTPRRSGWRSISPSTAVRSLSRSKLPSMVNGRSSTSSCRPQQW